MENESIETQEQNLEAEVVETEVDVVESDEGPESEEAAELAALTAKLAEAEQKAAEYLDGWQRAQAAFANFRKRTESENVNLRKAANAGLLSRLLPVVDDFERAFQSVPEDLKGNAWLEGFGMIQRKVISVLESEGVQALALAVGDMFDPMFHQAILYQEVEGFDEGQIVAVVEQGYVLGERVLRPAKVVVAKAPEKVPEKEPEESVADEDADNVIEVEASVVDEEVITSSEDEQV